MRLLAKTLLRCRSFERRNLANNLCRVVNRKASSTTQQLHFNEPSQVPEVPAYQVLNKNGQLVGDLDPDLTTVKILNLYREMITQNTMDKILFDSQRQGRISFYMTNYGEEAVAFGSASALKPEDWVFAQYREAGVLIHRKMPLELMMAQCYGNKEDVGKGRQMPIHYGSKKFNFVTLSSTLTTQLPQAAGAAFAFKGDGSGRIVMCYFGEGASSEGDAHAAMNFAATLKCPIIFLCRNNCYAISTPVEDQFASDGIVNRGLGYGMAAIRVDGNDLFGVYAATKEARRICSEQSRPVLIEAMTYRVGHHSTSDDSTTYRKKEEIEKFDKNESPLVRLNKYLVSQGLWDDVIEAEERARARTHIIEAFNHAAGLKKPPIDSMFEDVYDELPLNLRQQRDGLREHLEKYGAKYPINEYE